jgi:enoyl-CoA hydratase/carnithine racemase
LSSEKIRADHAEAYGCINRALPDADLDTFVEALATRIAKFDKCRQRHRDDQYHSC